MMNDLIALLSSSEIQERILTSLHEDAASFVLKNKNLAHVSEIASQIKMHQKAKIKIPSWFAQKGLIFPPSLHLEQSSSEATARFKANLLAPYASVVDLTGGFGIDSFFIAQKVNTLTYTEQNENLVALVKHNFKIMGTENIEVLCVNSMEYACQEHIKPTIFYIDPSRRSETLTRVVRLEDCTPDVIKTIPILLQKSKGVLLKTSPLLDIANTLRLIPHAKEVYVLSVHNECKEVLFLFEASYTQEPKIKAINLTDKADTCLENYLSNEETTLVKFSFPLTYLYEPNVAILKAGLFKTVSNQFDIFKISPHTHLYTSDVLKTDFQGRIFRIEDIMSYDKKKIQKRLSNPKANVLVRNFPLGAEQIKAELRIKDGGNIFLIAFTDLNNEKKVAFTTMIAKA